ncbi:MAG TPA: GGDEF domain-containing protein [Candidatus Saccharimonadales bacterium]|nr:GGDEF domain-containing protein [Candidatus Saccharimonadales bacterium]
MGGWGTITGFLRQSDFSAATAATRLVEFWKREYSRILLATSIGLGVLLLGSVFYLRSAEISGNPQTYLYLEIGGTLISFCYAANALVRFRGTHDRTALILSFGFVLSGIIETVSYFGLNDQLQSGQVPMTSIPMGWMVSRTLLGIMLLAAILIERYIPTARQPSRETAGALLVVATAAYLTSAAFLAAPAAPVAYSSHFFSRPWDLLPAGLFLAAAIYFRQRLVANGTKGAPSLYDYSLFAVAALNFVCHLAATFSRQLFDGPFFLAEISKTISYVVMLSGALLDQARLFEQVRSMAVSDSLTGLANYRRLLSVLEAELDRSRRTQRAFSVVLLDMDGLKTINDHYGHLTGSRALVRLGKILRSHSRAIDTAARYGGDEFALVLPEAGRDIAARVVGRVRERLAAEAEPPALSVSAGVAAFPEDGDTPEKLLAAADRNLYRMKNRGTSVQNLARIAACL